MSFDARKCTEKTRSLITAAQDLARNQSQLGLYSELYKLTYTEITPFHLMLALIEDEDKLVMNVMQRTQADVEVFEKAIRQKVSKFPTQSPAPEDINFSRSAVNVLRKAQELMKAQGDSYTAVDHVFLALCQSPEIAPLLKDANVNYKMIEEVVKNVRGGRKVDTESAEGLYALDFG